MIQSSPGRDATGSGKSNAIVDSPVIRAIPNGIPGIRPIAAMSASVHCKSRTMRGVPSAIVDSFTNVPSKAVMPTPQRDDRCQYYRPPVDLKRGAATRQGRPHIYYQARQEKELIFDTQHSNSSP